MTQMNIVADALKAFVRKLGFNVIRNNYVFDVQEPKFVGSSVWVDYLEKEYNKNGMKILEIGSRNVTKVNLRGRFDKADYIGFDFYAGENVDIVGDAHKLASYFDESEKFDLIFSSAVFEHLYMPWVVAEEIQKLLKIGGCVFVETHFSFKAHEMPWNFFQFSHTGLRALFNEGLGFELIDSGMSNPICGIFGEKADKRLRYGTLSNLYCNSEVLCKKVREIDNFDWRNLSIDEVVDGSRYPKPKTGSANSESARSPEFVG